MRVGYDAQWSWSFGPLVRSGHQKILRVLKIYHDVDVIRATRLTHTRTAVERDHVETLYFLLEVSLRVGTLEENDSLVSQALEYSKSIFSTNGSRLGTIPHQEWRLSSRILIAWSGYKIGNDSLDQCVYFAKKHTVLNFSTTRHVTSIQPEPIASTNISLNTSARLERNGQ